METGNKKRPVERHSPIRNIHKKIDVSSSKDSRISQTCCFFAFFAGYLRKSDIYIKERPKKNRRVFT